MAIEFEVPGPTRRGSVWLVRQRAVTASPGFTEVRHSDFDCPVVRRWIDQRPYESNLVEIDSQTALGLFEWFASDRGTWGREDVVNERFELETWRPCLRCGSVLQPRVVVCGRCFLTACDCEE